jgi:hypothetical protein
MTREIVLGAAAALAFMLGGCAYVEFRHPQTAETASCGTIPIAPWRQGYVKALDVVSDEVLCISDRQGAGFETVANRWR